MINMSFSVNPDQSIAAARRRSDRLLYADHVRGSLCAGGRGVAIATGPSAGISTLSFFCFFVLPTSTVGEVLVGVAVAFASAAFADDAKGHYPFFLVVCFAGDSFA
jgi:hypothetical protein